MALDNLISVEISLADKTEIFASLQDVATKLQGKMVNLTPLERKKYGKIGNETANWIQKVRDYMTQRPDLIPVWIDLTELDKDLKAHEDLIEIINRVLDLLEQLEDTSKLISADVYHASLAFYNNVKEASRRKTTGTTTIYQDLQQQFPGRPKSLNPPTP